MFGLGFTDPVVGKASIAIDRPVEAVFEFVGIRFFENYPKWSPEVIELEAISEGPLVLGTVARQVRTDQGHRSESRFRVTEYDVNRRIVFTGIANPFRCAYDFSGCPAGRSTGLSFTFEFLELELFMLPFEKLIRRVVQDGAERTVRNLKKLIEAQDANALQ